MDVDLIFKIAAIGILVAVLNQAVSYTHLTLPTRDQV